MMILVIEILVAIILAGYIFGKVRKFFLRRALAKLIVGDVRKASTLLKSSDKLRNFIERLK